MIDYLVNFYEELPRFFKWLLPIILASIVGLTLEGIYRFLRRAYLTYLENKTEIPSATQIVYKRRKGDLSVINKDSVPVELKGDFENAELSIEVLDVVINNKFNVRHAELLIGINSKGYFEISKQMGLKKEDTLPRTTNSRVQLKIWHNRKMTNFSTSIKFGLFENLNKVITIEIKDIVRIEGKYQMVYAISSASGVVPASNNVDFVHKEGLFRKGTPDDLYFRA